MEFLIVFGLIVAIVALGGIAAGLNNRNRD